MRLLRNFILFGLLLSNFVAAQAPTENLRFYSYSQSRASVIASDVPIRICELYTDELYLLDNKEKFGKVVSLTIKGRNYGDTLAGLPLSMLYLDSLKSFTFEQAWCGDWKQFYTVLAAIPSLRNLKVDPWIMVTECVTPELAGLQQITSLDIDAAGDSSYEYIYHLEQLEVLRLRANYAHKLSPAIAKLRNLHTLDLGFSSKLQLPEELGALKQLRVLNLEYCGFRSIPSVVFQLTGLEELYLNNNWIIETPDEIVNLTHLRILHLQWNWIRELPEGMEVLDSLRYLDVSLNRLRSLPVGLVGCDALEELYCWSSHFNETDYVLEVLSLSRQSSEKRFHDTIDVFYSKRIKKWNSVYRSGYPSLRVKFMQDIHSGKGWNYEVTPDMTLFYWEHDRELDVDELTRWRERKNPALYDATSASIWLDFPILPFGYRQIDHLQKVEIDREEIWGVSTRRLLRPLKDNPITELEIGDPFMRQVPRCIRKMDKLEILELNAPGVKELPEWIAEMPHLRELRIYEDVVVPDQIKNNRRIRISYL